MTDMHGIGGTYSMKKHVMDQVVFVECQHLHVMQRQFRYEAETWHRQEVLQQLSPQSGI